ncbi:hypothetical protein OG804_19175 [Nocardia sp. NBC_00416]
MSEGETPEVPRRPRRRAGDLARVDRVFGEVLPATTRDEWDEGGSSDSVGDEWLRSQVPPHHGGDD